MKLAVVVQRYGADLNGGAELHARYIAERLARHADVEVLTTCARDYITWRNELPAGTDSVNGLSVKRFKVSRERNPSDFGKLSQYVFGDLHSIADELKWLQAEGPTSPELIDYLLKNSKQYDYVIFFSYQTIHWSDCNRTDSWRKSVRFGYHSTALRPIGRAEDDPHFIDMNNILDRTDSIIASGFRDNAASSDSPYTVPASVQAKA